MKQSKNAQLNTATVQALSLLREACGHLNAILTEEHMRDDISMEVDAEVNAAIRDIEGAIKLLDPTSPAKSGSEDMNPPTKQQGQFLAFIREYMLHSHGGIAPSHLDLQRYFNLTPPAVNSMLIRLELFGFIRRIPRKARAIELVIDPSLIPPLDRPFKFGLGSRIM